MKGSVRALADNRDDSRRRVFAERLEAALARKALSASELATRVAALMPSGKFTRSNLSHYRSGRSLPRQNVLDALCKVLDVLPEELVTDPASQVVGTLLAESGPAFPGLRLEDVGDGEVYIQINQRLPWPDALRVLQAWQAKESAKQRADKG